MSAFLTGFQDYLKNQKCVSSNTLQSYAVSYTHLKLLIVEVLFYNVKCKSYCEKLCVRGGGS